MCTFTSIHVMYSIQILKMNSSQLLDMCLSMGSKDNMTSIIIKFPAQDIGEGGGVMARRQKREAAAIAAGGMTATVVDSDMDKAREEIMIEDTEAESN